MSSELEQEIEQTREHLGETIAATDKRPFAAAAVLAAGVVAALLLWPRHQ